MKKAAGKKQVMKAAAMKKTMKVKRVSKVAQGPRAKHSVFAGRKERTSGGLTKAALKKNSQGKVVSKAISAAAKKNFGKSALKKWADATKAARKALGVTGFAPVGGKSALGK